MKLKSTIEKFYTKEHELHVIELVSKDVYSREEAGELGYDDFEAHYYINHKFISDLSGVLSKSAGWESIVDDVYWEQLYSDQLYEKDIAA